MELGLAWGISGLRALVVAVAASALGTCMAQREGERWRLPRWLWPLAFVPLLPLVYVYFQRCFPIDHGAGAEAALVGLQILHFAPWAVLIASVVPAPPLDARARSLAEMGPARARRAARLAWFRYGEGRRLTAAAGFVWLLALQEFEAASLLNRPAFTVSLFDDQIGGMAVGASLSRASLGALLAVLGLMVLLPLWRATDRPHGDGEERSSRRGVRRRIVGSLAWGLSIVIPAWVLAAGPQGSARELASSFGDEWAATLAFAATAVIATSVLVRWLARLPFIGQWLALVPGLCGALPVALLVLATFQSNGLAVLYDTPLPVCVALTIWLLPFAWILERSVAVEERSAASTSAHLLANGDRRQRAVAGLLAARTVGAARWRAALLLFAIAAFEVQITALLAPTGWTPAAARLYNFMHYGSSPGLSALLGSTLLVLLSVAGAATLLRHTWGRWQERRVAR